MQKPQEMPPTAKDTEGFGGVVRELRVERGLTLTQLAKVAGVSISLLSRIETGQLRPKRRVVHALATALSVKPEALYLQTGTLPTMLLEAIQTDPMPFYQLAEMSPEERRRRLPRPQRRSVPEADPEVIEIKARLLSYNPRGW